MRDRRRDLKADGKLSPKILQAGEQWNGQPYIAVTEDALILCGSLTHGLLTDSMYGTTITGPLSLSEMPEYMSIAGGLWRVNPAVLSAVGSSAAMNIPWLVHDDPELVKRRYDMAALDNSFGSLLK